MKRLPHNKNKTTVHEANLKGVRHKVQRRQGEKKDEDILIVNTFWKRKKCYNADLLSEKVQRK